MTIFFYIENMYSSEFKYVNGGKDREINAARKG